MRIYDIVLFIFLFNLGLSMMIGMNVFDVQPLNPNEALTGRFNPQGEARLNQTLNRPPLETGADRDLNFGDFQGGMAIFFSAFSYATLGVLDLFNSLFPAAPELAITITIIIYFVYAAGAVQFILNRSFKVNQ